MRTGTVEFVVVHGTVRDALNVYPFASDATKKNLFQTIRGATNLDQEIRIAVDSQEEADKLVLLSRVGEAPQTDLTVESKSRPGTIHTVYYKGSIPVACSCESFVYSNIEACKHMKEVSFRGIVPPRENSTE